MGLCFDASLNSTSIAEKTFSSRERTIPVIFHRRKRRPFLAGVDDECMTG